MAYRWKPSKSQRRAFAERMQNDPEYKAAYEARKEARAEKRREGSAFNYSNAGGRFVPTKSQYVYAFENMHIAQLMDDQIKGGDRQAQPYSFCDAFNIVIGGYSCNESVHHDYIHMVNEAMREYPAY